MIDTKPMIFVGDSSLCYTFGRYNNNADNAEVESVIGKTGFLNAVSFGIIKPKRVMQTVHNVKEMVKMPVWIVDLSDDKEDKGFKIMEQGQIFFYDLLKQKPFNIKDGYGLMMELKNKESIITSQKLEIENLRRELLTTRGDSLFEKFAFKRQEGYRDIHDAGVTEEAHRMREYIKQLGEKK